MRHNMIRFSVACSAATLVGGCAASRQEMTNRRLVAAMPEGAESAMVWRLTALQSEGAPLSRWAHGLIYENDDESAPDELAEVVRRHIAAARPLVWAHGGSRFTSPPDLGLGNYIERSIWVTERPLDELRQALETGEGIGETVTSHEMTPGPIFEGPREIRFYGGDSTMERLFIAFSGPRIVVTAESLEDVQTMLERLASRQEEVPQRWRTAAAGVDLEAPVVVLRKHDPTNAEDAYSPANPEWPEPERTLIDSLALAMPDAHSPDFQLSVIAGRPQRTIDFFKEVHCPDEYYQWDVQVRDDGFSGVLRARREQMADPSEAGFPVLIMFGWNFYI